MTRRMVYWKMSAGLELSELERDILLYISRHKSGTPLYRIFKKVGHGIDDMNDAIDKFVRKGILEVVKKGTGRGVLELVKFTREGFKKTTLTFYERELWVIDNKIRKLELRKKNILEKMDSVEYGK